MKLLVMWDGLKEDAIEAIRQKTGAEVYVAENQQDAGKLIADADVAFGFVPTHLLEKAHALQWLQTAYAGVERILDSPWGNPDMILTNGSGIFGPCISEHIIGMMVGFSRGLHIARDHQWKRQWRFAYPMAELTGAAVGLLGYGDIGRETAKRLQPFGCILRAIRRSVSEPDQYLDSVHTMDQLDSLLPELDYLVCSLPHTDETAGLITLERMKRMPKTSVIINVGRGSLIPEDDLVAALKDGVIAGAGLDVTPREPLPDDSALWSLENLVLTPHNSGWTPYHVQRGLRIFFQNWDRFIHGDPLINQVEPNKGY